jgi:sigma-E factor negative regulatory protein RseA
MKPDRSSPLDDLPDEDARLWLSALADGDREALLPACKMWREDHEARQTWHAYHLIGDVLRSEDLAPPPGRDAAFLDDLRAKLAAEPLLLAPTVRSRRHWAPAWMLPAAAVAGVAVVAGALVVARVADPAALSGGATLAAAGAGATPLVAGASRRQAPPAGNGSLIRDVRLDEYLRAHQAARGEVAVAAPGGTLRRVDVIVPVGIER